MSVIRITPGPAGYALRLNVTDTEVFKGLVGALKRHVPSFDSFEKCWHVEFAATAVLEEWLRVAERRYKVEVEWEGPDGGRDLIAFRGGDRLVRIRSKPTLRAGLVTRIAVVLRLWPRTNYSLFREDEIKRVTSSGFKC
ncbi:MAG: hypothetical protein M3458_23910 [Acidobacteriota bacterium]|nr:hypothetical protein [Acidobacteriota bacterium]